MTVADNTPILVGVGQRTFRDSGHRERTPVDALQCAIELAMEDSGAYKALQGAIDVLITEPSLLEVTPELAALLPQYPSIELAKRLGFDSRCLKAPEGGNGPQMLVNHFAQQLHEGKARAVAIAGGELSASLRALLGNGHDISHWPKAEPGQCDEPWPNRDGANAEEHRHNLWLPTHMYPLFENALRHRYGHTLEQHLAHIGRIMEGLSHTACKNPDAWSYQRPRDAATLMSFGDSSPYLAFPYNRYLCAQMNVDMAAAVILTTVGTARELGIASDRWIYLHGCADANEVWYVSEREDLSRSSSIEIAGKAALQRAGCDIDDIAIMDLYSCFPCAVELACDALSIDPFGDRALSLTGGLPYFGGPGHSYSLHAITTIVQQLRERPEDRGLITANGWYMTKQSIGVYSATPPSSAWQRGDDRELQARIDNAPHPQVEAAPEGAARVDSYTVVCNKGVPDQGIIVGRLDSGARFIAHTEQDETLFKQLLSEDVIGQRGQVSAGETHNLFRFD